MVQQEAQLAIHIVSEVVAQPVDCASGGTQIQRQHVVNVAYVVDDAIDGSC